MGKTFLFNDTKEPKFMGGKLVPPGEGREVDDVALQPGEGPAATTPEAPAQTDRKANLTDLLKQPLKAITPELAAFSDETLVDLVELENLSDTPRKGLLTAVAELQLNRAQAKAGGPAA